MCEGWQIADHDVLHSIVQRIGNVETSATDTLAQMRSMVDEIRAEVATLRSERETVTVAPDIVPAPAPEMTGGSVENVVESAGDAAGEVVTAATDAIEAATETLADVAETVADAAASVVSETAETAGNVVEEGEETVERVAEAAEETIPDVAPVEETAPRRAHFLDRRISLFGRGDAA